MADKRSRRTRPRTPPAEVGVVTEPVTGVARGGIGTAANLEETQVLRTEELRSWAAAAEEGHRATEDPLPEPAPATSPAHTESPAADQPEEAPVSTPVAVAVVAAARSRRSTPSPGRSSRFAGLAGVLAVLFVVLAGVALVVSGGDGPGFGTGPAADATSSAAPAAESLQADGKKDGKDCKGKGRGNNCDDGDDGD